MYPIIIAVFQNPSIFTIHGYKTAGETDISVLQFIIGSATYFTRTLNSPCIPLLPFNTLTLYGIEHLILGEKVCFFSP